MSIRLRLVMLTLTGSLITMTGPVRAEQNAAIYLAADSASENTEINVRDKDNTTLTPEDQKETKKDIKITAHIRKAVAKDKSLSLMRRMQKSSPVVAWYLCAGLLQMKLKARRSKKSLRKRVV